MSDPASNPLGTNEAWNLVAPAYVTHLVPQFQRFSRAALARHPIAPGARVLDVATGPGTLALLAADAGARVTALDFAPAMVAELRARARLPIEVTVGDGQALPYPDASFDAAFSMFGLMFFPDRARGLAELARVLRPGGRATIASWAPFEGPFLLLMNAIRAQLPGMSFGGAAMPLSDPAIARAEISAAGFRDVTVEAVTELLPYPSLAAFWDAAEQATAPIVLLRHRLGEARWQPLARAVYAELERTLGPGPVEERAVALLTSGVR
jgi:SAM-dependent methyltransferase